MIRSEQNRKEGVSGHKLTFSAGCSIISKQKDQGQVNEKREEVYYYEQIIQLSQ